MRPAEQPELTVQTDYEYGMQHAAQMRAHAGAIATDCAQPELAQIAKDIMVERSWEVAAFTIARHEVQIQAAREYLQRKAAHMADEAE